MYCCGPWNTTRHSADGGQLPQLRIGARNMSTQRAVLRTVGIDQERDVVGLQPARSCRHQQAERMRADQRVLNLEPVLAKMRRLIHRFVSVLTAVRHITFFARPQVLSADQMPRSSRNRSIGADDLIDVDPVKPDAGPLEAAFLQHPARSRVGDARAGLQRLMA